MTRRAGILGRWSAVLAAALVAGVAHTTPATAASGRSGACTASDQQAVTVVIDYQTLGGSIEQYCASNLPAGAVGMDALRAVGVSSTGTTHDGNGFVCRLNGRPAAGESIRIPGEDDYRENCVNTPPATAYWSYWWAEPGGSWVYSNKGVLSHRVVFGGYEGWSFANDPEGGYGGKNPAPRVKPTAPATPKPTTTKPTPKPTAKPTPSTRATATATPSGTAKPRATPTATATTATPTPRQTSTPAPGPTGATSTTPTAPASDATVSAPPATGPVGHPAPSTGAVAPAEAAPDRTGPGVGLVVGSGVVAAAGAAAVVAARRRRTR